MIHDHDDIGAELDTTRELVTRQWAAYQRATRQRDAAVLRARRADWSFVAIQQRLGLKSYTNVQRMELRALGARTSAQEHTRRKTKHKQTQGET